MTQPTKATSSITTPPTASARTPRPEPTEPASTAASDSAAKPDAAVGRPARAAPRGGGGSAGAGDQRRRGGRQRRAEQQGGVPDRQGGGDVRCAGSWPDPRGRSGPHCAAAAPFRKMHCSARYVLSIQNGRSHVAPELPSPALLLGRGQGGQPDAGRFAAARVAVGAVGADQAARRAARAAAVHARRPRPAAHRGRAAGARAMPTRSSRPAPS